MSNPYNSELTADITQAGLVLTDSDNQALLPFVKAGDHDARQQMVAGNLPLVISIVEGMIGVAPQLAYLRDDMTSAGYTGLTKAVNRIKRLSDRAKVTSYLSVAIRRDIRRLLATEATIYVPPRSQQKARAKGKPIEPPCVVNRLPERPRLSNDACGDTDARDLFESCCTSDDERTLLAMREAKHTYGEIARAIGRPLSSTYVLGTALEERIQQKLESTG